MWVRICHGLGKAGRGVIWLRPDETEKTSLEETGLVRRQDDVIRCGRGGHAFRCACYGGSDHGDIRDAE